MVTRGAGVENDPIEIDLDDAPAPLTSAAGSWAAAAAPVAPAASATAPPKGIRKRRAAEEPLKRRLDGKSASSAGAAPTLDPAADDFGDDEEGQFSDNEPPAPAPVVRPSPSGPVDDADFDFSGSVAAVRQRCPLCDKPLALSWNKQRGRLENTDAVKLRSTVYHIECILIRRGPGEDQPAQTQGQAVLRR